MADERPVKPFLKYVGGKRWIAKRIIQMLPPHTCYAEPFGGMGAVLLAKERSKVEVWNDIDGGLANLMRVVKYHPQALADELDFMLMHRAERLLWRDKHPGETDIQRAARWIMVRHSGFQGLSDKSFAVSRKGSAKPVDVLVEQIRAVSRRLQGVMIESVTWQRCMDLYDSEQTVFFLDPPYADGDQEMYAHGFSEEDHRALRERLRHLKGAWILTYGDHPLIRDLYADCRVQEVSRVRKLNQDARRHYTELIILPR